jgi:multidrug efflux pump subunit AcrB
MNRRELLVVLAGLLLTASRPKDKLKKKVVRYRVYLDPKKLDARSLPVEEVAKVFRGAKFKVKVVKAAADLCALRLEAAKYVPVSKINDIHIRKEKGNTILLRDVGHAEELLPEP